MNRIWHPWHKWECYKAGFYETTPPAGMTSDQAREHYAEFLSSPRFAEYLIVVTGEWGFSCEHFLTNESINRIAWLGQASMCRATSVPSVFRGGFKLLPATEQAKANETAAQALTRWMKRQHETSNRVHSGMADARLL